MTEEKNINNQNDKGQNAQPAAEPQNTVSEHMIPKDRLDQEINRRKELEGRLAALEKASKEAEEKRLEEQDQWRELAQKRQEELAALQPKAAVAEEQEKSLGAYLKAQIEEIPEDMRSLIPEQLTTLQKLDWLAANRSKLLKPIGPDIGAGERGASGGGSSAEITQTMRKGAKIFGLTDEQLKRAAKRKAEKDNN